MSPRNQEAFRWAGLRLWVSRLICGLGLLGVSEGKIAERAEVDIESLTQRTLVIANMASEESMNLAKHYVQSRGIPLDNILYVRTTTKDSIDWNAFIKQIFNPLRSDLVSRGWIRGKLGTGTDKQGRISIQATGTRVAYLVTTWGLPYKIAEDERRLKRDSNFATYDWKQTHTATAAVDTELALLALNGPPIVSLIPNPYHKRLAAREPSDLFLKVSRIDGPGYEVSRRIVDDTLYAEKHGLNGRAYVDRGGPFPTGEGWLAEALESIRRLHYPVSTNTDKGLAGVDDRFDDLALYLGWYEGQVAGALAHPDFVFQRGAIAIHLHSFSGNFRNARSRWSGPLLAKGAAVTIGNVAEPYLEYTHHLDLLMEALEKGWVLGDALCYSLPAFSWRAMHVGDPLYRPFLFDEKRLEGQGGKAEAETRASEAAWRTIRQMNALRSEGRDDEAIELGRRQFDGQPTVAMALELGSRIEPADQADEMAANFEAKSFAVGAGLEAADLFESLGRPDRSVAIVKTLLFREESLPEPLKRTLWRRGARYAKKAGDRSAEEDWTGALKSGNESEIDGEERKAKDDPDSAKKRKRKGRPSSE